MVVAKTILVIDDDPVMLEDVSAILQSAQYRVITAADGRTALDKAYEAKPDLILCDIAMPDLGGFGVLQLLSEYLNASVTPFIFLTVRTGREHQKRGADGYLDGDELLSAIEMKFQKSKAGQNIKIYPDMDFFHRKENADFQKFIENRAFRRYRKGEVIYLEGHNSTEMFYIRAGKIKTYKRCFLGKELITAIYRETDCIGYVSLIGNVPYMESAVALTDAKLIPIPKQDFLSALYSSREIARNFIVLLSKSVHEVENRLVELAYQSVTQKVIAALLRMDEYGLSFRESGVISITRKDLSNLVGTAPESLNRALYGLKTQGLIELIDDGIRLLDKSALADLLRHDGKD